MEGPERNAQSWLTLRGKPSWLVHGHEGLPLTRLPHQPHQPHVGIMGKAERYEPLVPLLRHKNRALTRLVRWTWVCLYVACGEHVLPPPCWFMYPPEERLRGQALNPKGRRRL